VAEEEKRKERKSTAKGQDAAAPSATARKKIEEEGPSSQPEGGKSKSKSREVSYAEKSSQAIPNIPSKVRGRGRRGGGRKNPACNLRNGRIIREKRGIAERFRRGKRGEVDLLLRKDEESSGGSEEPEKESAIVQDRKTKKKQHAGKGKRHIETPRLIWCFGGLGGTRPDGWKRKKNGAHRGREKKKQRRGGGK